jgi:succinyl-diaminopimelate desuccinylase
MDDALRAELIDLTSALIRFPSVADRPDQLAAVAEYVARELAAIPGLFVHRSERAGKPAIVATLHETRTPALMLNAHLDVVRGLPEQFEPVVRDGRIYGRGAQDMKGSAAVLLRLLKDLARRDPRPDLGVQFVTDEEIGGVNGVGRLVEEGWRCGFFIVAEPTDLDICYEHKGGMRMDVIATGVPAHGSRPWAGRNPLLTLALGLAELNRRFPQPSEPVWATTITPTEFQAGAGSNNQIPPEARVNLDIRLMPDDDPAAIAAAVQACFPDATLDWRDSPPLRTDPASPYVQRLAAIVEQVRGRPPQLYREHFGTDARFYSAARIPAVCFGPVGAGLHSDQEWVAIESLAQLYNVLARFCTA